MDAPTDLTRDGTLTDTTQVTFTWSAPTDDGGSPITGYSVELNQGGTFTEVGTTAATVTSLTYKNVDAGVTY